MGRFAIPTFGLTVRDMLRAFRDHLTSAPPFADEMGGAITYFSEREQTPKVQAAGRKLGVRVRRLVREIEEVVDTIDDFLNDANFQDE
jgi:hypothetical protein